MKSILFYALLRKKKRAVQEVNTMMRYGYENGKRVRYVLPDFSRLRGKVRYEVFQELINAKPLNMDYIQKKIAENDAHLQDILDHGGTI